MSTVEDSIIGILHSYVKNKKLQKINYSHRLFNDLGLSSLDILDLVLTIESVFDINVGTDIIDIKTFSGTVRDLSLVIEDIINGSPKQ